MQIVENSFPFLLVQEVSKFIKEHKSYSRKWSGTFMMDHGDIKYFTKFDMRPVRRWKGGAVLFQLWLFSYIYS